ncbi:MAG: PilZ domain-containing protein [Elusimicrobia bacterium]|nr:PilZ domain-containing protein [Elusimicrobiota bacterium]
MFQGEEKRKYIRVMLDLPCRFSSVDCPSGETEGKIIDLSLGAFAIETSSELTIGENLKFNMSLPGVQEFEFSGQVLREVGERKYALRLSRISLSNRAKLGNFILTRLEEHNYVIKKFLKRKDAEN